MAKQTGPEQFTTLELELMKILWDLGPASVQAVHQRVQSVRPLAYNSVQTVLNILHRKGKVKRVTKDRAYIYSPTVSQQKAAGLAVQDLINRLFAGQPEQLVMSMLRERHITPEKLAELQQLIDESEGAENDSPR